MSNPRGLTNDLRDTLPLCCGDIEVGNLYRHALPSDLILRVVDKVRNGQVKCEVVNAGSTKMKAGTQHSFLLEYLRPY